MTVFDSSAYDKVKLPLAAICEMVGVSADDWEQVHEWTSALFDDPDLERFCRPGESREEMRRGYRFDITRTPNDHLAFGHGAHFCLGVHLARWELRAFFRVVAPLLDGLQLDGEQSRIAHLHVGPIKHQMVTPALSPLADSGQIHRNGCDTDVVATRSLLVVDDEENLRVMLSAALRHYGFEVMEAVNGREALAAIAEQRPDLVVLDITIPRPDGLEVLRSLRAHDDTTPVLLLSARDDVSDRVRGLSLGADDYLPKPFNLEELIARIEAIFRRIAPKNGTRHLEFDDLVVDLDACTVQRAGKDISLSPTEFRLLVCLMSNAGRVLSKAQLLEHVWEYDFGGRASVAETYISYLRRKIEIGGPKLIHTIRGFGYVMRVEQ